MTVGNTFEILIPTFNGERYLALCLLALSRSTTRDFSVRIGPEGTWKGGAELEAFCERLALPVVISQAHERIGLAANRARLLGESRSDYVLWLDDDVLVSPDSIAKLLSHSGTLGARNCLLTGVGSNLFGHPTVTCGLGFTLFRRDLLIGDPVLDHPLASIREKTVSGRRVSHTRADFRSGSCQLNYTISARTAGENGMAYIGTEALCDSIPAQSSTTATVKSWTTLIPSITIWIINTAPMFDPLTEATYAESYHCSRSRPDGTVQRGRHCRTDS